MRIVRMVAALALLATPVAAQAQATPAAPVEAKPPNSRFEFRVGAMMMSAERNSEFFRTVSTATGSVKGVDVLLRGGVIGLAVRSLTSDFGDDPNVTSADARILIGTPLFAIHVGAGRRVLWSDLGSNVFDIGIAGFTTNIRIGGSGLRANIGASIYMPAGEAKDKMIGGLEGETSLIYTLPKIPIFVQLGYRAELFTAKTVSGASTVEAPEELRGIRLGVGLQLGGR